MQEAQHITRRQANPGPRRAPLQAFLRAALLEDLEGATKIALAFMAKVRSRTTVIVDLFDTTQQYIGERWRVGAATALDEYRVSIAIEAASEALPRPPAVLSTKPAPKAVLLTLQSEQHNLGLNLVGMAFADDGWNVQIRHRLAASDILQMAWRERPSLVAVSATYDSGHLRSQLRAFVREMIPRNIPFIVGGSAFTRSPELGEDIGHALVAHDARVAVITARRLTRQRRRHTSDAV